MRCGESRRPGRYGVGVRPQKFDLFQATTTSQSLDNVLVCDDGAEDSEVRTTSCDDELRATVLVADFLRLLL